MRVTTEGQNQAGTRSWKVVEYTEAEMRAPRTLNRLYDEGMGCEAAIAFTRTMHEGLDEAFWFSLYN